MNNLRVQVFIRLNWSANKSMRVLWARITHWQTDSDVASEKNAYEWARSLNSTLVGRKPSATMTTDSMISSCRCRHFNFLRFSQAHLSSVYATAVPMNFITIKTVSILDNSFNVFHLISLLLYFDLNRALNRSSFDISFHSKCTRLCGRLESIETSLNSIEQY